MSTPASSCAHLLAEIRRLQARLKTLRADLKKPGTAGQKDSIRLQIEDVLSELADDETQAHRQGCIAPPAAATRWEPVSPFAIQMTPSSDPAQGPYNAGRVNAILALPAATFRTGAILIGTDTGGVWLYGPPLTDGHDRGLLPQTTPLSNGWEDPDVVCLAQGLDADDHVYAGCRTTLYESLGAQGPPFLNFWRNLSPGLGMISRIAVFSDSRRIVLATSKGVFWSHIPGLGGDYSWQPAQWPNLDRIFRTNPYSDLAIGPAGSICVAANGDGKTFNGIFFGEWTPSAFGFDLVMQRAAITGINQGEMLRTSLASSVANRMVVYAVAARANGWILGVLKSTDGGRSWSRLATQATALNSAATFPPGTPLESGPPPAAPDVAGGQGFRNNCIAVSPGDSKTVVIGWRNGPWISTDGGQKWTMKHSAVNSLHVHADLQSVHFDPNDRSGSRFYVGSDGGVVATADGGETFDSSINRNLVNLQFASQPPRAGSGRSSASASNGLFGGGLQDNGNVYAQNQTPWRQVDRGDGQMMMFFPASFSLHHLLRSNNNGKGVRSAVFNGTNFDEIGIIPVAPGKPGVQYPLGLQGDHLTVESVRTPEFRNAAREIMFAVAGLQEDVYGLFADPAGGNMHWEYLATVPIDPGNISLAAGSGDGNIIFAGSEDGRLFAVDPRNGSAVEQILPQLLKEGSIFRIVVVGSDAYAIFNLPRTAFGGFILRANRNTWEILSGGLPREWFYALEAASGGFLFAATDSHVYASSNAGNDWFLASTGLPVRPHCADLRYVQRENGQTLLYLSTFGRSAWRLQL